MLVQHEVSLIFGFQLLFSNLVGMTKLDTEKKKLDMLLQISLVMDLVKDTHVKQMFANTNARLYRAFLGIDNFLQSVSECGNPITSADKPWVTLESTWANAYSTWMTDYLNVQGASVRTTASQLSQAVPTSGADTNIPYADFKRTLAEYDLKYTIGAFAFDFGLTWPKDNPLLIARRTAGPACTLSRSASASASGSGSTTATASGSISSPTVSATVTRSISSISTTTQSSNSVVITPPPSLCVPL